MNLEKLTARSQTTSEIKLLNSRHNSKLNQMRMRKHQLKNIKEAELTIGDVKEYAEILENI